MLSCGQQNRICIPVLLSFALAFQPVAAQTSLEGQENGVFDLGNMLAHHGALPVPTVITEPAVGYGLGLGLLFFSSPKRDTDDSNASDGKAPPNITGAGGFATGTHSYGYGIGHFHTWDDDSIRYFGAAGKVNLNLNYYDSSGQSHAYQLDGIALVQQVLFRIGTTPWYIGPRYTFFDSHTRFDNSIPTRLQDFSLKERIGKGGVVIDYDTRDNIFYPNRGTYAEVEADAAGEAFGGSTNFRMLTARAFQWIPIGSSWVLGLRIDSGFSGGSIPFFAQPYVTLRGVSQAKYQDRDQITGEAEIRWNVTHRWSVLGFGGLGRAYGRLHEFSDAPTAFGVGTGFRYLIAEKLGLAMGIDVAHGPGQNAVYVQVGSAWR